MVLPLLGRRSPDSLPGPPGCRFAMLRKGSCRTGDSCQVEVIAIEYGLAVGPKIWVTLQRLSLGDVGVFTAPSPVLRASALSPGLTHSMDFVGQVTKSNIHFMPFKLIISLSLSIQN